MATKALASKTGQVKFLQKGDPGAQGPIGPLVYPAGEYSASTGYTRTALSTPMVLCEGQYYVLAKEGTFKGVNPKTDYAANGSKATWVVMDKIQYAFIEVLMANFAKLASAVFYGQYMFSQQGVDANGNPTNDYRNFGTADFTPNLMFDFLRGCGTFSGFIKKVRTVINQDNFYDYFEYVEQWGGYAPYADRLSSYVELAWVPANTMIVLPNIFQSRILWPNNLIQDARANIGNVFILLNNSGTDVIVGGCTTSSTALPSNVTVKNGHVLHAKCTAMVNTSTEYIAWTYIEASALG